MGSTAGWGCVYGLLYRQWLLLIADDNLYRWKMILKAEHDATMTWYHYISSKWCHWHPPLSHKTGSLAFGSQLFAIYTSVLAVITWLNHTSTSYELIARTQIHYPHPLLVTPHHLYWSHSQEWTSCLWGNWPRTRFEMVPRAKEWPKRCSMVASICHCPME